jgi:hypothetical protein
MEIVNITYNGEGVDYQDYSKKDDGLVLTSVIYNKFGFPNDIIEYHIYDENGAPLDLEYNAIKYYPSRVNAVNDTYSEIELDPKGDVYSKGYTRGTVNIHYNFLRNLFRSKYDTTYWIKEISVSRTEIKLSSQAISDAFIRLGFDEYQVYSSTKIYYSENFLSNQDLEQFDLILANSSEQIEELQKEPGGYKVLEFDNPELVESLGNRVKELIVEQYGEVDHIYPRNEIQFLHINTGMSPHDDGQGQKVAQGIVIYLSNPEDYEGGEIYYPRLNIELKPKRGSIVIHPRENDYTHGVKEVKSGSRFVTVMFTG